MSIPQKQFLINLIAALLIFLFVYTGTNKLMDVESFHIAIAKSPLLNRFSVLISWAIPLFEIGISALLFIPHFRRYGFLLSAVLLALFSLYITYMLIFIPHLPCSCGGIIQQMNWTQHLIFNLIFFSFSFCAWIITKRRYKNSIAIDRLSRTPV